MVRMCAEYSDLCNIPDHYNGITDLPDIKVIYFLFSCADAEDSSSSEPDELPPMRNGVSDEYQTDTPKYSVDTLLILG